MHTRTAGPICIKHLVHYTCNQLQRGLIVYALYTHMRLFCYDSYTSDPDTKDQLALCAYSYSVLALGIRYYIREDRESLALLADGQLVPRPRLDMYL